MTTLHRGSVTTSSTWSHFDSDITGPYIRAEALNNGLGEKREQNCEDHAQYLFFNGRYQECFKYINHQITLINNNNQIDSSLLETMKQNIVILGQQCIFEINEAQLRCNTLVSAQTPKSSCKTSENSKKSGENEMKTHSCAGNGDDFELPELPSMLTFVLMSYQTESLLFLPAIVFFVYVQYLLHCETSGRRELKFAGAIESSQVDGKINDSDGLDAISEINRLHSKKRNNEDNSDASGQEVEKIEKLMLEYSKVGRPMNKNEYQTFAKLLVYDIYCNFKLYNKAKQFLERNSLLDNTVKDGFLEEVENRMNSDPYWVGKQKIKQKQKEEEQARLEQKAAEDAAQRDEKEKSERSNSGLSEKLAKWFRNALAKFILVGTMLYKEVKTFKFWRNLFILVLIVYGLRRAASSEYWKELKELMSVGVGKSRIVF